jgi:flagellar assembly factor FliW
MMSETEQIVFENAKFGEISVGAEYILEFPEGIPGFERFKRFGLVTIEEEEPFIRLLSIEEPRLGFVLVNPMLIWPDYNPDIGAEDLDGLDFKEADEMAVYCIVTLSAVPSEVTVNLKGPIFLNARTMMARQMILMDENYETKHSILAVS